MQRRRLVRRAGSFTCAGRRRARFTGLEPLEPRLLMSATEPAPLIIDVDINDGDAQRSMVRSLTVTFDSSVSGVMAGSLQIRDADTQSAIALSAAAFSFDGTTARWDFTTLSNGTLPDGNFTATILAEGIVNDHAVTLDGDGDGFAGGDFEANFHRLFGDSDGDRDVDLIDTFRMRQTLLATVDDPNFDDRFDSNSDGDVDFGDTFAFRANQFAIFGATVGVSAMLANDTAPNGTRNSDGVTADGSIVGRVAFADQAASVRVRIDGGAADSPVTLAFNGGFLIDMISLETLNGGPLSDGPHTVHLEARDSGGGVLASAEVGFTLDTAGPVVSSFDLSPGSDTGAVGDQQTSATVVNMTGQTESMTSLRLLETGGTTLSNASGVFQFPDLTLALGDNTFTIEATDTAGNVTQFVRVITRIDAAAEVDPVLFWNQVALDTIRQDASTPPFASRALAMMSAAVYDVVNAIEGTAPFMVARSAPAGASLTAGVAAAAHEVLSYLFPGQRTFLDGKLTETLDMVTDGMSEDDGVMLGQQIGSDVVLIRTTDGWDDYVDYVSSTEPGKWRETEPMFDVALLPQWADLTPFAMVSPDQFRLAGPPALDSQAYADALNEVKLIGRTDSSVRTMEQTQIARFWVDGLGTYTPPGHWNQIATLVAQQQGLSVTANARLLAQLNVAMADAAIASWDAKYHYEFWRPVTAIREAALDNNPLTDPDPTWTSFIITPAFPEYTSGHSTFSGAAAEILTTLLGDNIGFTTFSLGLPGVDRSFTSFNHAADEASVSRIYGGIHFRFSTDDGMTAGRALGQHVLDLFQVSTDERAPVVIVTDPLAGAVVNQNPTIAGRVIDNLSGVASLAVRIDGGAAMPVAFDPATGQFSLPLTLPTDGSADGAHTLQFIAVDQQGNSSDQTTYTFTLDTIAPSLEITSIMDGGSIAVGTKLTGIVGGTGSAVRRLSYMFDGMIGTTLLFNPATGAFDQTLNLSQLSAGDHVLTVTAVDTAGNMTTQTLNVTLAEAIPLSVTHHTPIAGALNVGSTFRPQVFFSRAIDPSTLNANNFYATFGGQKLAATIVPANDNTFAWLFFDHPLPGASLIRITVDGDTIMTADGQALDADGDGTPGGVLTYDFSTVSLVGLPDTTLSGIVLDPGPDLKPMTQDDLLAGPDGSLHTADDIYRLPLAGVKVFILGLEDQFVVTGPDGRFQFDSVPGGTIKLAVEGNTATNAPAGYYFPEMVMDLEMVIGQANTVMGTMGPAADRAANRDRPEVYLPRLQTMILQDVSETDTTMIHVDPASAPNLTDEERSVLTLEVTPGSVVGMDGQPLSNAQLGISTVPPELVRDMLPPGLLQHTFDITIQAPNAASFAEPLRLTMPNVFNAPPGAKLNYLSFDHTTGRLVIEGTATVSEDGLSVVTDPESGITKPGWHGLTPPGGDGCGGGPPPPPPPPPMPDEMVMEHDPVALPLIRGEMGSLPGWEWMSPPTSMIGPPPPPPPPPGCAGSPPPPDTEGKASLTVHIEVDGPLDAFMKKTGDLGMNSTSFTLVEGEGVTRSFKGEAKTYDEVFGANGFKNLFRDVLYGSKIKITEIRKDADGNIKRDIYTYVLYRWVDVVDAGAARNKTGVTAAFHRTLTDDVEREKQVWMRLPGSVQTEFEGSNGDFDYGSSVSGSTVATWTFDPSSAGLKSDPIDIKVTIPTMNGDKEVVAGFLAARGTATAPTKMNPNIDGFKTELERVIKAIKNVIVPGADFFPGVAMVDDDGNGTVDDASEYMWPGSDDRRRISYPHLAGVFTTATLPGPDGMMGTADDLANQDVITTNTAVAYAGGNVQWTEVSARYTTEFTGFLPGDVYTQAQLDARVQTEADRLLAAVRADYNAVNTSAGETGFEVVTSGGDFTMTWKELGPTLGGQASYDSDEATLRPIIMDNTISDAAKEWALAEALNKNVGISIGEFAIGLTLNWTSAVTLAQKVANVVSHELGHTFGLNDAYRDNPNVVSVPPIPDLMNAIEITQGDLSFSTNNNMLLRAALGMHPNGERSLAAAYTMYRQNINLPGSTMGLVVTANTDYAALQPVIDGQAMAFSDLYNIADTIIGTPTTVMVEMYSAGTLPVTIHDVRLATGTVGVSIDSAPADGTVLNPGESVVVQLTFDPAEAGRVMEQLIIETNATDYPQFELNLRALGVASDASAAVNIGPDPGDTDEMMVGMVPGGAAPTNNFGGVVVEGFVATIQDLATIANVGAQPLEITAIRLIEGIGRFNLLGVPADLASSPITLATGESFTFGATFDPDRLGLDRALIEIVTNDPAQPVRRISAVGTGVEAIPYPQWGDDYVAIDTPDLAGSDTLRTVSDDNGNFSMFLPVEQFYRMTMFDPTTGLVAVGTGRTAIAGQAIYLTRDLVFQASTAPDSDFDGLPDDIEHARGTFPNRRDTNDDGIDDFSAIAQGIDPLGDNALPIGIIGTVRPQGAFFAQEVVANRDTAFVAAREGGLQVIDFRRISAPVVIASVPAAALGGNAVAVDFTSVPDIASPGSFRNLVAVALGDAGLAIADVTDPPAAFVAGTLPVAGSAQDLVIVDNIIFVGGRGGLVSVVDIIDRQVITTFTVTGSGDVSDMAFSGGVLFTLRGGRLAAYDVTANLANPPLLSSLDFGGGATDLFVGTDRAYVAGDFVFESVDISNPAAMTNPSGERPQQFYRGVAANGSGRLLVGTSVNFGGNRDYQATAFNVVNPDDTNTILSQFQTPGSVQDIWIQNGLGLIADGAAGFAIFNYINFDSGDQPPTVMVTTTSPDGSTAVEGQPLRVDVDTLDDVQVREVRLSANGVALEPDGSFPYSFFAPTPLLESGATTLTLQVTATDTGGNATTQTLEFDIVPDTIAPQLLALIPPDDEIRFDAVQSYRLTFSEGLDLTTLNAASVQIISAGPDEQLNTGDDISVPIGEFDFRDRLNLLTIRPASTLGPGRYELRLDRSLITDKAGNPLGTGVLASQVTVQAIPFNAVITDTIETAGDVDLFSFEATEGQQVTLFANWNAAGGGLTEGQIALLAADGSTILASGEGANSTLLADITLPVTGVYTVRVRAATTSPLGVGNYEFTISDPETDVETIAYGQTLTRNIAVRGDDHEWAFNATAGDIVSLSYVGPELEGGITIRNPDGTVESVLLPGTTIVRLGLVVSQTGTYRFDVDDDTSTGSYLINLEEGSFVEELAGQFNTVQNENLDKLFSIDRYRYALTAGDEVTVFASFGGVGRGTVRILDAATGDVLAGPVSGSSAQLDSFISPLTGDVFVEITGQLGQTFNAGSYSLTVSDPETAVETIAFGDQAAGTIAVRGDSHEFAFEASGGEQVTFGYRGPHLESGITILRPDLTTLIALPQGSTLVTRDLMLDQAGTYSFIVNDFNSPGAFTVNLSNPADVEDPGTPLTANVTAAAAIDTVFDIDVFTFSAAAGQSFTVVAEWRPAASPLNAGELQLIDPLGTVVSTVSGTDVNQVIIGSALAGDYSIRMRARGGNDFNTGNYRLTTFSGAEDPTDDTIATAHATGIVPGGPSQFTGGGFVGDNVHGLRDVDMYTVEAERGDLIIVDINAQSIGSGLNSYLRLFNSGGMQVAANDNFAGSLDSNLVFLVLESGVYHVGVSASGQTNYNPDTAGTGNEGQSVGAYDVTIDVVQDFDGPIVTAVTPSGVSTAEDITQFTVDFNERLSADTANDPSNYALTSAGDDGIFGNGDDVAITVTPAYNDNLRRVTLTTAQSLPAGFTYRLTLSGAATITDIAGNPLNNGVDHTAFLDVVTSVPTPTAFPVFDGFESGVLAEHWQVSTTGGGAVSVTNQSSPATGLQHAIFSATSTGRATLIMAVDLSALDPATADVDLRFAHREADGNDGMPASFSGRVNADGVAISDDGVNWIRVVNFGATSDGGYTTHVVDLDGVIRSAGLSFSDSFQIMFQHLLGAGQTAFIDDVELATDLAGPTITSLTPAGPLVFSNGLSQLSLAFSEPLNPASAVSSNSYQLRNLTNGAVVGVSASLSPDGRTVTLTPASLLSTARYELRVRGDDSVAGTTQVRDAGGNLLNNGVDSLFTFEVATNEAVGLENDELVRATATGIVGDGGSFSFTTAIGNNSFAGRDVDLYRFNALPGDRVTIEALSRQFNSGGIDVSFDTLIRLFDASGNQVASHDNIDAGNRDSRISNMLILSTGTYYVGISAANNANYNPQLAGSGVSGPRGKYQFNLTVTPDDTNPTVTAVVPHAGPNVNQSIDSITVRFSEDIPVAHAENLANYQLVHLGPDGVLGGGDDTLMPLTATYDPATFTTTLSIDGPAALVPLPTGSSYRLLIDGTNGIRDIAGNQLGGGVDVSQLFRVIAPEDPLNDRIVDAVETGILADGGMFTADGAVGDNAFGARDVDLYRFEARDGVQLTVTLRDQSIGSPLLGRLRLFNSAGSQLTAAQNNSADDMLTFNITATDTYYIGVSGNGNSNYNPNSPGSGAAATHTGEYILEIGLADVTDPTITAFTPGRLIVDSVSQITARFSEPIDLAAAEAASSYLLDHTGPDRRFGTADDLTLPFTVAFDLASNTATLTTDAPMPDGDVRVTFLANVLVDRSGRRLNGGVNDVRIFSIVTDGADVPFFTNLDDTMTLLNPQWLLLNVGPAVTEISNVGTPRAGDNHLRMRVNSSTSTSTSIAILAIDPGDPAALEMSFYAKRSSINEDRFTLPTTFTDPLNTTGDGVAISVDGVNWRRVVNLADQTSTTYDHFVVDLKQAAMDAGLPLDGVMLIRFSNSEFTNFSSFGERYFDDLRIAAGPAVPVVEQVVGAPLVTLADPTTIVLQLSSSVTEATATDPANYMLTIGGQPVAIGAAIYDDMALTVTLVTADGDDAGDEPDPLSIGTYALTIQPNLMNAAGVALNEGLAQTFTFDLAPLESVEDDTAATATATGLSSAMDGQFNTLGAIGNSSHGSRDVDLYVVEAGAGQRLAANVERIGWVQGELRLRVFNAAGMELTTAVASGLTLEASTVFVVQETGTYYVGVSGAANSGYNIDTAGSGAAAATGLYNLEIRATTSTSVPPILYSFDDGLVPTEFEQFSGDATGRIAAVTDFAASPAHSLLLGDTDFGNTLVQVTLTVDATFLPSTDLRFKVLRHFSEGVNPLNPSGGSYVGTFNGDGVAFSVDGNRWYPLIDFLTEANAGNLPTGQFATLSRNLNAAAAAVGVTLTSSTFIRFQNLANGPTTSSRGYFFDDITIDGDLIGPLLIDATGDSGFVIGEHDQLTLNFNEPLNADTANDLANYRLHNAGPDALFGTPDDVHFTLSPVYDDASRSVVLDIAEGVLPNNNYLLTVVGSTSITDVLGNRFNNGRDQVISFRVIPAEDPVDDTIAAASDTGIDSGGAFQTTAFLGDNSDGPDPTLDDVDLYRITAQTGDLLFVRARSNGPDLRLRMFDAAGNQLTFLNPAGNDLLLDGFAMPEGEYFIGISDDANDMYDPINGGGDAGVNFGFYDLNISIIEPTTLPFFDGFESGGINEAHWDIYASNIQGTVFVSDFEFPGPISGNYSAFFGKPGGEGGSVQVDLTLHVDLTGQDNVELRFKENNRSDGVTNPAVLSYAGRHSAVDGVFISGDGTNFFRVPDTFISSFSTQVLSQKIDLDELASTLGIILGPNTRIRFSTFTDSFRRRVLDDVQLLVDEQGPIITSMTSDGGNTSAIVLDTNLTMFNLRFDDRLDPTLAIDPATYELRYAGLDGIFAGQPGDSGDDEMIPFSPLYDGHFVVNIAVDPANLPLLAGKYRLTIRGSGPNALTDREGNLFNGGVDDLRGFQVVATGPSVLSSVPTNNATLPPAAGFSSVDLNFSKPIDPETFTADAIHIVLQPDSFPVVDPADINIIDLTGQGTEWRITFPSLMVPGSYELRIDPTLTDLAGTPMNQDGDTSNGEPADDAFLLQVNVSDPGGGTIFLNDQGGYRYDVITSTGYINDGGLTVSPFASNSYDAMFRLNVGALTYSSNTTAFAFDDGGRTVRTGLRQLGGLLVHRDIYVPADDQFVRFLEVLTNPTDQLITQTIRIFGNLGSNTATTVVADSSGSGDLDLSDTYLVTDDAQDAAGTLALGFVMMDGNALTLTDAFRNSDNLTWDFTVSIAPGQTVRIMTLGVQQLTQADAVTRTENLVMLPANALANLSDDERGSILNFYTGIDSLPPVVLGTEPNLNTTVASDVQEILVRFSETLDPDSARDAANYELLYLGADGVVGGGDDQAIDVLPVYVDDDTSVTLVIDFASTPLANGNYQLTLDGTGTITDAALNPLNGGEDYVASFTVRVFGPRIIAQIPGPQQPSFPVNFVDVVFDRSMDPASFTTDDVTVTGPDGTPVDVLSVTPVAPAPISEAHSFDQGLPAGGQLNSSAQLRNGRIVLVEQPLSGGSFFFEPSLLQGQSAYAVEFDFLIFDDDIIGEADSGGDGSGGGGDAYEGMTFAVLDASVHSPSAIGLFGREGGFGDGHGRELAYGGLAGPNYAVELDVNRNSNAPNDPNDNHVGVNVNGDINSIALTDPFFQLDDNQTHRARVEFNNGLLTVYLDDFTTPLLQDVVLPAGAIPSRPLIGFTASTGGFNAGTFIVDNLVIEIPAATDSTYRVAFDPRDDEGTELGTYDLMIGPDIRDAVGMRPMDQNRDGENGTVADAFVSQFTVGVDAPRVIQQVPFAGAVYDFGSAAVNHVQVIFDRDMDPSSFDLSDVMMTGPGGMPINVTAVIPAVSTPISFFETFDFGLSNPGATNGTTFIFNGEATLVSEFDSRAAGSVFFDAPFQRYNHWDVTVDFRTTRDETDDESAGGEGMTIAFLDGDFFSSFSLGASGSGNAYNLGYGGLGGPSFAIEIDNVANTNHINPVAEPGINHIGINVNGSMHSLAVTDPGFDLDDTNPHGLRVVYRDGVIDVYIRQDPDDPLTETMLFSGFDLGMTIDRPIIGATASTGGHTNGYIVDNFSVDLMSSGIRAFDIFFDTQTELGAYELTIGPDIRALADMRPMDQNHNFIPGEAGDAYLATFSIGGSAARIISQSPSNLEPIPLSQTPIDTLTVTFDRQMDPDTFGPDDITLIGPDAMPIAPISILPRPAEVEGRFEDFEFGAPADATLNGEAQIVDGQLQLTDVDNNQTSGSMFFDAPAIDVYTRWEVAFDFTMSGEGDRGEGLTVAFLDADSFSTNYVAPAGNGLGHNLGYGGLGGPSFAVEIDTQQNTNQIGNAGEPDSNHLGVNLDGNMASIVNAFPSFDFNDGNTHRLRVVYEQGFLDVYLQEDATDPLTEQLMLSSVPIFKNFRPIIGFTASNGGDPNSKFIDNVQISLISPANRTFDIQFDPQDAVGPYTVHIGPDIHDAARGRPMDQNGNGVFGETGDFYNASFVIGGSAPRIISQTPDVGAVVEPGIDSVVVAFDSPIDPLTFSVSDVLLLDPMGEDVAVVQIVDVTPAPLRIADAFDAGIAAGASINGSATIDFSGEARLTVPLDDEQAGSLFYNPPAAGPFEKWSVEFDFRIEQPDSGTSRGGEGMTVAFLDAASFTNTAFSPQEGGQGRNMGYGGLMDGPSFAIEIDTTRNDNALNGAVEPNDNHIGLDVNGSVASVLLRTVPFDLNDGQSHRMRVVLDDGILDVFMRYDPADPASEFHLIRGVPFEPGFTTPIIGFTASTGGSSSRANGHFVDNVDIELSRSTGSQFRVDFIPQNGPGEYVLTVGPDIRDERTGQPMDQNDNQTPGEPGDAFVGGFVIGGGGGGGSAASAEGDSADALNEAAESPASQFVVKAPAVLPTLSFATPTSAEPSPALRWFNGGGGSVLDDADALADVLGELPG